MSDRPEKKKSKFLTWYKKRGGRKYRQKKLFYTLTRLARQSEQFSADTLDVHASYLNVLNSPDFISRIVDTVNSSLPDTPLNLTKENDQPTSETSTQSSTRTLTEVQEKTTGDPCLASASPNTENSE